MNAPWNLTPAGRLPDDFLAQLKTDGAAPFIDSDPRVTAAIERRDKARQQIVAAYSRIEELRRKIESLGERRRKIAADVMDAEPSALKRDTRAAADIARAEGEIATRQHALHTVADARHQELVRQAAETRAEVSRELSDAIAAHAQIVHAEADEVRARLADLDGECERLDELHRVTNVAAPRHGGVQFAQSAHEAAARLLRDDPDDDFASAPVAATLATLRPFIEDEVRSGDAVGVKIEWSASGVVNVTERDRRRFRDGGRERWLPYADAVAVAMR